MYQSFIDYRQRPITIAHIEPSGSGKLLSSGGLKQEALCSNCKIMTK